MLCDRHGAWGSSGGARNPEEAPPASGAEAGGPYSRLLTSHARDAPEALSHVLPQPASSRKPAQTTVLPLLGNFRSPYAPSMEPSPCYLIIVSGLGARDPSPQLGCIPSRTQPPSHIPERSRRPGGPTQAQDTPSLPMLQLGVLCLQPMG